jgi:hypothetical protein
MTYLELVNNVLRRLRETEVSSVNDSAYSKLIAQLVNDAKREVEDSWEWNALYDTITVSAVADTYNYTLTNSGVRFKVIDVINDTQDTFLRVAPTAWLNQYYAMTPIQRGSPDYYNFRGTDSNGDTKVNIFPVPDTSYNIQFHVIKPQAVLTNNADVVKVPSEPITFLAYAKALAERGEDGGLASSEAYGLYRQSLADHVAIEQGRNQDFEVWTAP